MIHMSNTASIALAASLCLPLSLHGSSLHLTDRAVARLEAIGGTDADPLRIYRIETGQFHQEVSERIQAHLVDKAQQYGPAGSAASGDANAPRMRTVDSLAFCSYVHTRALMESSPSHATSRAACEAAYTVSRLVLGNMQDAYVPTVTNAYVMSSSAEPGIRTLATAFVYERVVENRLVRDDGIRLVVEVSTQGDVSHLRIGAPDLVADGVVRAGGCPPIVERLQALAAATDTVQGPRGKMAVHEMSVTDAGRTYTRERRDGSDYLVPGLSCRVRYVGNGALEHRAEQHFSLDPESARYSDVDPLLKGVR